MDDGDLLLRVFGPVEAVRDGRSVAVGGPKPRMLLALLLANRGRSVATDRLCEELWGGQQPTAPAAVLQSHVSRLRRALRPEVEIVSRPPGYALEVDEELVDAGRFEHLVGLARTAPDVVTAAAWLEAALALWRGPTFEEFAHLDWARGEAVRLDEIRLVALEELIEARLATGRHVMVIGELERLVEAHPLRERYWLQLMVALYRSGRQADALRRAEMFRALLRDESGLDPSPAVRELEHKILGEDPALDLEQGQASIAPRRGPADAALVGRERDVEGVTALVRSERLVTLAGPGGVGKTRLAWRVAADLWDALPHGVFVVELGPVRDPASAAAAIATALDVQQRQHLSVEDTMVEYLRDRRALLVLDNCEHLLDTVGPLVGRLCTWCPDLTVLTTSREPLGLAGEHVWPVAPLELAPPEAGAEAVAAAPAVRLFLERAAASRPGFALTDENAVAVDAIVRGLDGLPLAIELAASRLRAMSPAALAERLDQRFHLLGSAHAAADPRHRTLHDLVAWSYELLTPAERLLFERLCLFAGGFDLDAAEVVCALDDLDSRSISSLLAHLVDKSMVQLVDPDAPRYRLLETLREFGLEQLDADERAAVRDRHARWYLDLAERSAGELTRAGEADAVRHLDRDVDNLRVAHSTAIAHGDADLALRLVAALREYAFRTMRYEVTSWAAAAADVPGAADHPRLPLALATVAYGHFARGDLELAIAAGDQAVAAGIRLGVDSSGLAERVLANAWFYRGDVDTAIFWMGRMLDSARASGSPAWLAHALYMSSVGQTSTGDGVRGAILAGEARAAADACGSPTADAQAGYALGLALESTHADEAAAHLRRAAETAAGTGHRWLEGFAMTEVLWLQAREGDPVGALAGYADVVDIWYRAGDWSNQWLSLRHVLGIFGQLGAFEAAATLHGAASAAGAAYALPFEPSDAEHLSTLVGELKRELGSARFAAAVRRGAALRDAEIISFVHDEIARLTS